MSKREVEELCYDELVTMLDIWAYANADEKERQRIANWAVDYRIGKGLPVSKEEARSRSMFG